MGGPGEIETKEVPLMSPEQQKILSQLLQGTMSAMEGFPLGQAYGGAVESSWQPQPFMGQNASQNTMRRGPAGPGGMPVSLPGGNMGRRTIQPASKGKGMGPGAGGIRNRPEGAQSNANLMADLLSGPMPNIMTEGMTGNIPKFRPRV